ncbi:MAG: glycosyltransferase family 2 protein [Symploca sp. SIO1B1]|nr:glycosyltransferase family 2 protein [Symploca sp. SIO1B1]
MLVILLPAYNEEKSLPILLPKIQQVMTEQDWDYRIIVCDDGSKDGTRELLAEYAQSLPIEILYHKINRGLGETIRDLFEYAADLCDPDDTIVRMDCDDTHEPLFIPHLTQKLAEGYDVVIASRFRQGGGQLGVSSYRAVISYGANIFMRFFFGMKGVRDHSCGFRAYRAAIIQQAVQFYGNNFIQLKGLGFTGTLEKLVKLKILGAKFAEVPFVLRYDQKQSDSKMISSITTLGYIVMTITYHWPWSGWRTGYKKQLKELQGIR